MPSVLRDREHRPIVSGGALARPSARLQMLYHPWAELFGGGDLEWTPGISARILRIGWLFFILVSVASYTANLAAFFTAKTYEIRGPQSMMALRSSTACIPDHGNDEAMAARAAMDWGVGETMAGVIHANSAAEFANATDDEKQKLWGMSQIPGALVSKCAERVKKGEADLIMTGRDALTAWVLNRSHTERCDEWTFSTGIALPRHNPVQMFLAMDKGVGWTFFSNLQASLAWMRQFAPVDVLASIYSRELRRGEGCPPRPEVEDTTRIPLNTQGGVFLICGVCIGLALLVSAAEAHLARGGSLRFWERRQEGRVEGSQGTSASGGGDEVTTLLTDSEMLRRLVSDVNELRNDMRSRVADDAEIGPTTVVDREAPIHVGVHEA